MRARYTLEFKQEAVRLVRGGEKLSAAARTLGVSAQSLDNWVKAEGPKHRGDFETFAARR